MKLREAPNVQESKFLQNAAKVYEEVGAYFSKIKGSPIRQPSLVINSNPRETSYATCNFEGGKFEVLLNKNAEIHYYVAAHELVHTEVQATYGELNSRNKLSSVDFSIQEGRAIIGEAASDVKDISKSPEAKDKFVRSLSIESKIEKKVTIFDAAEIILTEFARVKERREKLGGGAFEMSKASINMEALESSIAKAFKETAKANDGIPPRYVVGGAVALLLYMRNNFDSELTLKQALTVKIDTLKKLMAEDISNANDERMTEIKKLRESSKTRGEGKQSTEYKEVFHHSGLF